MEEESWPVLFSGTIPASAFASKHYVKSHILSRDSSHSRCLQSVAPDDFLGKLTNFWNLTQWSPFVHYQSFIESCCMYFQSAGSGFFWNSTYPPDYYSVTNHQTVIITFTDVKTSHSYSASSFARDSIRPYLKAEPNIISWNHIQLKKETNPFTKCSGFHKKQLMTKKVQKNSLYSCFTPLSWIHQSDIINFCNDTGRKSVESIKVLTIHFYTIYKMLSSTKCSFIS